MKKRVTKAMYILFLILAIFQAVPTYAITLIAESLEVEDSLDLKLTTNEVTSEEKVEDDEEIFIEEELVEKRTANEKHFKMSDGTIKAYIYDDNIHYKKNGKYVEIDNSLEEDSNGNIKNKNASYKVTYPSKRTEEVFQLEKDGHVIVLGLKNTKNIKAKKHSNDIVIPSNDIEELYTTLVNKKSKVSYEEIMTDVDLVYENYPEKVKESIILKKKGGPYKFQFTLNLDTKTIAVINSKKEIEIKDKETKENIFVIESPYMYDSNYEYNSNIDLTLKEEKNYQYTITMELDKEWLKDEERSYPVVVDPTIVTSTYRDNISDTIIYEGDSNNDPTNRMYAHFLRIGSNNFASLQKNPVRALVKFTLPNIMAGDQVISAKLNMTSYPQHQDGYAYPSSEIEFNVHKMTAAWESASAYWSNLSATSKYDTVVSDYVLYNYSTSSPIKTYEFDITRMVKEWYTTGTNNGLMIKEAKEVENLARSDAYFYSSDTSSTYETYRPQVVIQYMNQTGLEDYLTYTSVSKGSSNIDINNYNGNLVLTHSDATTPGNRLPISVEHIYNTNDIGIDLGYGIGFRLNYSQTIEIEGTLLKYTDEDGTRHWFYEEENVYKDESGLNYKITSSGTNYILEDKVGNKSTFVKSGDIWYLKEIKDTNNNKITVSVNSSNYKQITSITDSAGKSITFTYSNNKLASITDSSGRVTKYTYTNNYLTKIEYPDGEVINYTYNTNKMVTKVTGIDNSNYKIEYHTKKPYRVKSITEYGTKEEVGNSLTYSYGENTTRIVDQNSRRTNYVFNNLGQTTSITTITTGTNTDEAYGKSYQYDSSEEKEKKNKLTLESNLIHPTNNYVLNSSFENDLTYWPNTINGSSNTNAVEIVTNESYLGKKSVKIETTELESVYPRIYQNMPLVAGNKYTLSFYVKGEIEETTKEEKGVMIYYEYKEEDGTKHTIPYGVLEVTSEWERREVTVEFPSNSYSNQKFMIGLQNTKGTIYVDCVQVEKGVVANPYNLVVNGSFDSGDKGWIRRSNLTEEDKIITSEGSQVFQFTGSAKEVNTLNQTIEISGNSGDVFHVSLWAKNMGVPTVQGKKESLFHMAFYKEGTRVQRAFIFISADCNNWQYISKDIIAEQEYDQVLVEVGFNKNKGKIYYDNISLFKGEKGNNISYDSSGNVSNVTSSDNEKSNYTYDKRNQLVLTKDNRDNLTFYEYDFNKRNRLNSVTTNTGIKTSYEYDNYGNVLKNKTEEKKIITVEDGKEYYFRNVGSNLYLGVDGIDVELVEKSDNAK